MSEIESSTRRRQFGTELSINSLLSSKKGNRSDKKRTVLVRVRKSPKCATTSSTSKIRNSNAAGLLSKHNTNDNTSQQSPVLVHTDFQNHVVESNSSTTTLKPRPLPPNAYPSIEKRRRISSHYDNQQTDSFSKFSNNSNRNISLGNTTNIKFTDPGATWHSQLGRCYTIPYSSGLDIIDFELPFTLVNTGSDELDAIGNKYYKRINDNSTIPVDNKSVLIAEKAIVYDDQREECVQSVLEPPPYTYVPLKVWGNGTVRYPYFVEPNWINYSIEEQQAMLSSFQQTNLSTRLDLQHINRQIEENDSNKDSSIGIQPSVYSERRLSVEGPGEENVNCHQCQLTRRQCDICTNLADAAIHSGREIEEHGPGQTIGQAIFECMQADNLHLRELICDVKKISLGLKMSSPSDVQNLKEQGISKNRGLQDSTVAIRGFEDDENASDYKERYECAEQQQLTAIQAQHTVEKAKFSEQILRLRLCLEITASCNSRNQRQLTEKQLLLDRIAVDNERLNSENKGYRYKLSALNEQLQQKDTTLNELRSTMSAELERRANIRSITHHDWIRIKAQIKEFTNERNKVNSVFQKVYTNGEWMSEFNPPSIDFLSKQNSQLALADNDKSHDEMKVNNSFCDDHAYDADIEPLVTHKNESLMEILSTQQNLGTIFSRHVPCEDQETNSKGSLVSVTSGVESCMQAELANIHFEFETATCFLSQIRLMLLAGERLQRAREKRFLHRAFESQKLVTRKERELSLLKSKVNQTIRNSDGIMKDLYWLKSEMRAAALSFHDCEYKSEHMQQHERSEKEVDECRNIVNALRRKIEWTNLEISELKEQNSLLQDELIKSSVSLNELTEKNIELKMNDDSTRWSNAKDLEHELKLTKDIVSKRDRDLLCLVTAHTLEINNYSEKLLSAQRETEKAVNQLLELRINLEHQTLMYEQMTTETNQMKLALRESEDKIDCLDNEVLHLRACVKELDSSRMFLEKELQQLTETSNAAAAKVDSLQSQVNEKQEMLLSTKSQLKQCQLRLENVLYDLQKRGNELISKDSTLQQLIKCIDDKRQHINQIVANFKGDRHELIEKGILRRKQFPWLLTKALELDQTSLSFLRNKVEPERQLTTSLNNSATEQTKETKSVLENLDDQIMALGDEVLAYRELSKTLNSENELLIEEFNSNQQVLDVSKKDLEMLEQTVRILQDDKRKDAMKLLCEITDERNKTTKLSDEVNVLVNRIHKILNDKEKMKIGFEQELISISKHLEEKEHECQHLRSLLQDERYELRLCQEARLNAEVKRAELEVLLHSVGEKERHVTTLQSASFENKDAQRRPDITFQAKQIFASTMRQLMTRKEESQKLKFFLRWTSLASASHSASHHGKVASELALQLEETREKLIILKRHLKKQRRVGSRGGDFTGMDCINEGYETL